MPDTERFGELLRRLRLSRRVTVTRWQANWRAERVRTGPLSLNELARRAGLDPGGVHKLERGNGGAWRPSRRVVEALARGLECDDFDRERLLIAAGFWPWTGDMLDPADVRLAVRRAGLISSLLAAASRGRAAREG